MKPLVAHSAWIWALFASAANASALNITLSEQTETVFDWSQDACDEWDVPDIGVRAFRNEQNEVVLFASHSVSRAKRGESLTAAKHQCEIVFEGHHQDDPKIHDDHAWLAGLYTEDGKTVHALVHNEFHGHRRPELCEAEDYIACWRNSVTYAVSKDGGRHFEMPKQHLVAALPYAYDGAAGKHTGYFNPTNIIKRGDHYYAMFAAEHYKAQRYGMCLMRTQTLDDPSSWRAWDGEGFKVAFANVPADHPEQYVCTPVGRGKLSGSLAGLVQHQPSGLYLLTLAAHRMIDGKITSGFYLSTSPDLIEWSDMQLIKQVPVTTKDAKAQNDCAYYEQYPALLDEDSANRNFESINDTAYLYFTRIYLKDCGASNHRDLLRQKIKVKL